MDPQVVKSEQFFLSRSKLRKHPNLKDLSKQKIDTEILEQDEKPVAKKGNAYKNTKSGYRKDIELNVRSSWEANFVRILNLYKVAFEFEPTVFSFPIKRRNKRIYPRLLSVKHR
jgi:hypothetical protein